MNKNIKSCMECSICMEILNNKEQYNIFCGHIFHKECIDKWNKTSNRCPLCRKMYVAKNAVEFFKWFDEKITIIIGNMSEETTTEEYINLSSDIVEINNVFFECVDSGIKFGIEFIYSLMEYTISFRTYFYDIVWYNNTIKKFKKLLYSQSRKARYNCIIS